MTDDSKGPAKPILIICAVILVLSAASLFKTYTAAQKGNEDLQALRGQITQIGEEISRLRAQVEAGKAGTAAAATPAPAATAAPSK